jgi:hypothetical protein
VAQVIARDWICKVQPIHNDFRAGLYRVIYSSSAYSAQIGYFGAINVGSINPEESRGIEYKSRVQPKP